MQGVSVKLTLWIAAESGCMERKQRRELTIKRIGLSQPLESRHAMRRA